MRRIAILAVTIVLALGAESAACVCGRIQSFESTAARSLVVRGIVRSYVTTPNRPFPVAMDVEVRHVIAGAYGGATIRIIGDFGASCIPYVSRYPIGTEWLFAVNGPMRIEAMGDENFSFEPCTEGGVRIENGRIAARSSDPAASATVGQVIDLICSRRAEAAKLAR